MRWFDGLETIEWNAFKDCVSLLSVNIPASIVEIDDHAFMNCPHLHNVAFSPHSDYMNYCHQSVIFPFHKLSHEVSEICAGRWDWHIHRLSFYHSRREVQAKEYNNPLEWLDDHKGELDPEELLEVDCLGMTALHVLACSGTHDLRLYRRIVDGYPDALTVQDYWGETPLGYAMLSGAPKDVLHYLLDMHKQMWGFFPFDFGKKIKSMALCKSAECIRGIIQAQRKYFPELVVNWQKIVNETMQSKENEHMYCKTPISVFQVLVEASAST